MKLTMLSGLFNWVTASSTRWQMRLIPTETPSLRYVKKLRTLPVKFTGGHVESRAKMARILNPDFHYTPADKTDIRVSMERYKEKVKHESVRNLHSVPQTGQHRGGNEALPRQRVYGQESRQFAVITGKGETNC